MQCAKRHQVLQTKVGDRYVLEAMREGGYVLGGEQSGHMILLEHNSTGDGLRRHVSSWRRFVEAKSRSRRLSRSWFASPNAD
ncbi:MAG: hypothetical protein ACLTQI_00990 [Slackia sp.]